MSVQTAYGADWRREMMSLSKEEIMNHFKELHLDYRLPKRMMLQQISETMQLRLTRARRAA